MGNPVNEYRKTAKRIKKSFAIASFCLLLPFLLPVLSPADELATLFADVEKLNIGRYGYTLGKVLSKEQKKTAVSSAVKSPSPGTYKFKDKNLYVVAHESSDRVLIIYEQYNPASQEKIRDMTGALFLAFGDPTVMAHDKIVYWVYGEKGKISREQYQQNNKKKKRSIILATVKLNSSESILEKGAEVKDGSVYYVISSEPVLKLTGKPAD
ncbi:hypothetical protein QUF76_07715 [Desulfobacterales bacterium HSG16]|nr:hypothetical protein [Desulfobacterales bacterium HSG16]